jgi:hypothetical protein
MNISTPPKPHHRTGAGARINADHINLYRLIVAGIFATATAALIRSWQGLLYVAAWQGLPSELRWTTAVMLDVAIIVFKLGDLAKASRGENRLLFQIGAYGLTSISSIANWQHTVSLRGLDGFEDLTGAALNALAPLLILLTTEVLGSLVTRPKRVAKRRPRRVAKRRGSRPVPPIAIEEPAHVV